MFGITKIEWKKIKVDLPKEDNLNNEYLPNEPRKLSIIVPQYNSQIL